MILFCSAVLIGTRSSSSDQDQWRSLLDEDLRRIEAVLELIGVSEALATYR